MGNGAENLLLNLRVPMRRNATPITTVLKFPLNKSIACPNLGSSSGALVLERVKKQGSLALPIWCRVAGMILKLRSPHRFDCKQVEDRSGAYESLTSVDKEVSIEAILRRRVLCSVPDTSRGLSTYVDRLSEDSQVAPSFTLEGIH